MFGNANLTIAMRQQDAGRTREWLEKTAGQTNITQATSYLGASDGSYREARHADVKSVSRVDWRDLTSLIEGEAIVLFGSRRVYARLFHARIDDAGPKRIGRSIGLRPPKPEQVRAERSRFAAIAAAIEGGRVAAGGEEEASPALAALLQGFADAAHDGGNAGARIRGALAAISQVPEEQLPARPPPASRRHAGHRRHADVVLRQP